MPNSSSWAFLLSDPTHPAEGVEIAPAVFSFRAVTRPASGRLTLTVHIDAVGGALMMVACVVGYFVYKHTRQGPLGKGDIVGAIVCGTSVLTALVLILGGDHSEVQLPEPGLSGVPSTSSSPASSSGHQGVDPSASP